MNMAYVMLVYLALFTLAEVVKRKLAFRAEITRSFLHITAGIVSISLPLFINRTQILAIAVTFFLLLIFSRWKNIMTAIHGIQREGWGELFFPLGIGLAAWWWLPESHAGYVYALSVMTFADVLANIVGSSVKRWTLFFNKGLPGFVTFFVTATIIGLFFFDSVGALWRAAVLGSVELCSPRGTDNLTIVIAAIFVSGLS